MDLSLIKGKLELDQITNFRLSLNSQLKSTCLKPFGSFLLYFSLAIMVASIILADVSSYTDYATIAMIVSGSTLLLSVILLIIEVYRIDRTTNTFLQNNQQEFLDKGLYWESKLIEDHRAIVLVVPECPFDIPAIVSRKTSAESIKVGGLDQQTCDLENGINKSLMSQTCGQFETNYVVFSEGSGYIKQVDVY